MAGPQPRLHLPFAQWPAEDRARWASAVTDDDPFSDAPGARLAKTTLHARWMAWRRFLGFLTVTEPEALQIPLTERITIARVRQLAKHLGKTNTPHSVAGQIATLYGAARILLPENDWSWLREIKARLYTAAPSRGRSGPVITSVQLLDLGLELMAECAIEPGKTVSMADAIRYRDGFMIALIAFMAPRHKNLAAMEIGRNLFQEGENWFVVVPPEETKTGAPIDFQVPDVIRSHLAAYLDRVRPRLLRRPGCKALWVSAKGGALSYSAVGPVMTRHTRAFALRGRPSRPGARPSGRPGDHSASDSHRRTAIR
jgi:hypothetical protein